MKLKSLLFLSALSLGVVSCSEETDPIVDNPPVTDSVPELVDEPVVIPEFVPPSPVHIALMFKESGLKYIEGVMHKPDDVDRYSTGNAKMMNLGVYSADIAYMVVNEETSRSMDHMNAIRKLSGDLDLNTLFDTDDLITRFEANLKNQDSLLEFITSIQEDLDTYVDDNDESHMRLMVFTGAWVQSMYLGGQSVIQEGADEQLSLVLSRQMDLLSSLLPSLNAADAPDGLLTDVRSGLQEAYDVFVKMNGVKLIDGEVDYENIHLNQEDITILAQKMQDVRDRIIEG